MIELSSSVNGGVPTPQRRKHAIQLVYDDGEYSENEEADIMVLFMKNVAVADTYANIPRKSDRVRFIRVALGDEKKVDYM